MMKLAARGRDSGRRISRGTACSAYENLKIRSEEEADTGLGKWWIHKVRVRALSEHSRECCRGKFFVFLQSQRSLRRLVMVASAEMGTAVELYLR